MPKGSWGAPRLAAHFWALGLALFVLGLAPLELVHPTTDVSASSATVQGMRVPLETSVEQRAAPMMLSTDVGPMAAYRVRPGDTLAGIAARAGITVQTLTQVNQLVASTLTPGQQLLVPPVDGTMVPIDPNQSIDLLAQTFRLDTALLQRLNGLRQGSRLPSQIFVPALSTDQLEATAAAIPSDPSSTHERLVRFIWPARGILTQPFWQYHPGIDIANVVGTPEYAADGGKVVWAGWGDYGIYVEIDHGNGFQTVYGHMSEALVKVGQVVSKGQLIGLMGATGRATGPHLHFEIRYNGVPQNPLYLLS